MKFPKYVYKRHIGHFSQCLQMGTVLILHLTKLSLNLWIGQEESLSHSQGFARHVPSLGMQTLYVQSLWNVNPFFSFLRSSFLNLPQLVCYISPTPPQSLAPIFFGFAVSLQFLKAVSIIFFPCLPCYAKQIHILYESFECLSSKLGQLYTIIYQ